MSRNRPNWSAPLLGRGYLEIPGFGRLWLMWSGIGLVQVAWAEHQLVADTSAGERKTLPRRAEVPKPYRALLGEYFLGRKVDPVNLPVDMRGTPFQIKVWRALRKVPRGEVRSYAEIAADIGSPGAARAVGTACRDNPLPIVAPCHRIVASSGRLGGYSGGPERKIRLLSLEGVRFYR